MKGFEIWLHVSENNSQPLHSQTVIPNRTNNKLEFNIFCEGRGKRCKIVSIILGYIE